MTSLVLDRAESPLRTAGFVAIAGIAIGVCYMLSPLSVLCLLAIVPLFRWAGRGLDENERRWLMAILITAVVTRVLIILGLFLVTDHTQVPFGSLFGDEYYFIRRSLWMGNAALGLPMNRADFVYAFDDYSRTSFLYVLAMLQMFLGQSPYGVHLFNILCYVGGSIVFYRLIRPSYGRLPALLGLVMLLFLPTQFAWSLSALKEPLYFLVTAVGIAAAVAVGRPGPWMKRLGAVAVLVASAYAAQGIREGGFVMAGAGAVGGLALSLMVRRPRFAIAFVLATLVVAPLYFSKGTVKDRMLKGVRQVVEVHWGHVNTPGYVFTIMDGSFYMRKAAIAEMTLGQTARYFIGSFVGYVVVPLPWKIQSRAALTYLPEQMVWYLMVLLVPFGMAAGFRRDSLLTLLLATCAATAVVLVAITSGNIGTLVRHRGLALPYLLWFSVLGACEVVAYLTAPKQDVHAHH